MYPTPHPRFPFQQFSPRPFPFPQSPGFPPTNVPIGGMPYQQGFPAQSSGLLSRFFGGAAAKGAGGGMNNLLGMLQHAQRAMGVYQQVKPMVQQYGPIIRNMPAMYRMLKGNIPQTDSSNQEKKDSKKSPSKKRRKTTKKTTNYKSSQKKRGNNKRTTTPKLYV